MGWDFAREFLWAEDGLDIDTEKEEDSGDIEIEEREDGVLLWGFIVFSYATTLCRTRFPGILL
jgi:hypothetical protein